jgi:hypothetical protein
MAIQSAQSTQGPPAGRQSGSASLAELVSVILDKGIVIDAWARVSIIGIEILTVEARAVVASVDTYLRYAEAIGLTALASAPGNQQGQTAAAGQGEQRGQQQLPSPDQVRGYLENHPQGVQLNDLQAYFDAPRDDLENVLQELVAGKKAREDAESNTYLPADDDNNDNNNEK